jgi:hypothetical protein
MMQAGVFSFSSVMLEERAVLPTAADVGRLVEALRPRPVDRAS